MPEIRGHEEPVAQTANEGYPRSRIPQRKWRFGGAQLLGIVEKIEADVELLKQGGNPVVLRASSSAPVHCDKCQGNVDVVGGKDPVP